MSSARVVDVGSLDVNGSLRDVCPSHFAYCGVDMCDGKGVDVVLDNPYGLPFESESIDIIVCSSCLEHSNLFWVLFLEMLRILKPEGLLYVNAPSNGQVHRYPLDCWRFYPDAGIALVEWAETRGYSPALLESFIGDQRSGPGGFWNDFVAVFIKDKKHSDAYPARIMNQWSLFCNGRLLGADAEIKPCEMSEDMTQIEALRQQLTEKDLQLAAILNSKSWKIVNSLRWIRRLLP